MECGSARVLLTWQQMQKWRREKTLLQPRLVDDSGVLSGNGLKNASWVELGGVLGSNAESAQLETLEKAYAEDRYLWPIELSVQLGLTDRQVQAWFYQRQSKDRKIWKERTEATFKNKGASGGLNMMGKTKERACSSINTLKTKDAKITKILQKDPKFKTIGMGIQDSDSDSKSVSDSDSGSDSDDDDDDQVGHNTGKTRQRTWENTETPKKKLKQTQKVEKISSPQSEIILVHGYQVKRSNATILETIFKKHGDIAAECILKTDDLLSSIMEAVCEVVRQIQTGSVDEKMKELECRLSIAEASNINVTWLRAHLEAVNKRKDSSKKYTSLMGMKQNASLVKIGAQKDLRERCDELVVAQQRFTTAERCVRVLNLVEKNLNDQLIESKSELDSCVNHPVV